MRVDNALRVDFPGSIGGNAVDQMKAVVTTGCGGYEMLSYRTVPLPALQRGDVLLQVLAAGINNTDINTRLGWYDPAASAAAAASGRPVEGWNGATPFPLVQGADCCGRVAAVAPGGDRALLGRRVLVRPCMRRNGFGAPETRWMGTDFDGAFAQFVKVPESEVFPVSCGWSDVELASIPCAYGTAENMLQRAHLAAGEHVLVTGASGGVGSAAVQLARRRGARVTAVVARPKMDRLREIGADAVLARDDDLLSALGAGSVDLVVDNVAGPAFGQMLKLLRRGGRYVSSGAVAGAQVALDMRDFYLRDLTLIGCTAWDEPVFPDLIGYIERGEIRPLVAGSFALHDIAQAQRVFLERSHVGNLVLVPAA